MRKGCNYLDWFVEHKKKLLPGFNEYLKLKLLRIFVDTSTITRCPMLYLNSVES